MENVEEKFETLEDYVQHLKTKRIGCYDCKHKGSVMGSVHSSCHSPLVKKLEGVLLLKAAAGIASLNPIGLLMNEIPMQDWNEIGIRKGYVIFPINFDPVWLNYCLMFENKNEVKE